MGKTVTKTDVMLFNDLFNPFGSDRLTNSRSVRITNTYDRNRPFE